MPRPMSYVVFCLKKKIALLYSSAFAYSSAFVLTSHIFSLPIPSPPPLSLFPYTTLFLSYLAAALPELNAWERAGADASSAGMVDAGFENQKELTKMQLEKASAPAR